MLLKKNLNFVKLRLLFSQGKIKELYDIFINEETKEQYPEERKFSSLSEKDIKDILLYCKICFGEEIPENIPYFYKQVKDYNRNRALQFMQRHEHIKDSIKLSFKQDFGLKKAMNLVVSHYEESQKFFAGFYSDVVYFKCNNCGCAKELYSG